MNRKRVNYILFFIAIMVMVFIPSIKVFAYTIIYELNGGANNALNPSSYNKSTPTITLKDPSKTGYKFSGWYTDTNLKTKVTTIKKVVKGIKFYMLNGLQIHIQ